ncbi:MAG: SH3 domain-containing protein [Pseudomonadota bacterium]
MRWLCFLLLMIPAVASAQNLPALYDVDGVAQSDTLNVRAGPSTEFDVIDTLSANAEDVEVVDVNASGEWALIIVEEQAGWVALRFLKRQPRQSDAGLPQAFTCYGTEPFWSFNVAQDQSATFSEPDQDTEIDALVVVPSRNRTDRYALFGDGGEKIFTTFVAKNQCNDGMSDRVFGLSIDLLVTGEAGVSVYSGCCSVSR